MKCSDGENLLYAKVEVKMPIFVPNIFNNVEGGVGLLSWLGPT